MSELPFFVYTSKYEDTDKQKEIIEKKQVTQLTFNKEINNKMELFNTFNLFTGSTSLWIREHVTEIGSLNVFMMALTHLLIMNVLNCNRMNDTDYDYFDPDTLMDEFSKSSYDKYKKYITDGKEYDRSIFTRNIHMQISVYTQKIRQIIESEEQN